MYLWMASLAMLQEIYNYWFSCLSFKLIYMYYMFCFREDREIRSYEASQGS